MRKNLFTAAMSRTASAAHADAASPCADAASSYTGLFCVDAIALASIFILFALLAGLVCLCAVLGVILAVLVITLLVQGVKNPSEAKWFA